MSQDSLAHKKFRTGQRQSRVRKLARGTAERPRLSIHITNQQVSAQIINDEIGKTLVYASSVGKKNEGSMSIKAEAVGGEIAKKAQKAKIKQVVFDRGARLYHGRTKKLAEAARKGGLEF